MGEVYRARDTTLERDVAVKLLPALASDDPQRRTRLLREARAAASLNHPNICTIHEVGEAEGRAYIAMEVVEGESLSKRVAERPLPAGELVRFGVQLADAVAHAHERGIVHRDLKSSNVMITPEGRVKVLDFGLAKSLGGEELADLSTHADLSLTEPGAVVGTLPYMAPEQLRGVPADARSDIWALGVVLHEMAAGARPFTGRTGSRSSAPKSASNARRYSRRLRAHTTCRSSPIAPGRTASPAIPTKRADCFASSSTRPRASGSIRP